MYPAVTKSKNLVWNPLSRKKEKKKGKTKKRRKEKNSLLNLRNPNTRTQHFFLS